MDDRDTLGVIDDADFQRLARGRRTDEHVTSGSSVSKPRQWCRSAWSMSPSETPCLRALASMSTSSGSAPNRPPSAFVDGGRSELACWGEMDVRNEPVRQQAVPDDASFETWFRPRT